MGIVPPPGQDQVPRLQAFRAEHPDIKIASPGRLARAHVGRLTRAGTILVVRFGLCQLPGRLDELLASG